MLTEFWESQAGHFITSKFDKHYRFGFCPCSYLTDVYPRKNIYDFSFREAYSCTQPKYNWFDCVLHLNFRGTQIKVQRQIKSRFYTYLDLAKWKFVFFASNERIWTWFQICSVKQGKKTAPALNYKKTTTCMFLIILILFLSFFRAETRQTTQQGDQAKKQFSCPKCNKPFPILTLLQNHVNACLDRDWKKIYRIFKKHCLVLH